MYREQRNVRFYSPFPFVRSRYYLFVWIGLIFVYCFSLTDIFIPAETVYELSSCGKP